MAKGTPKKTAAKSSAKDSSQKKSAPKTEPVKELEKTPLKQAKRAAKKDEARIDAPDELAFDVQQFSGGLKGAVESILIIADSPLEPRKIAATLAVSPEVVLDALKLLSAEYSEQRRGFELGEFDGLWRFYSAPEYGEIVQKFIIGTSESKLSIAALETLAIVAYRQPINRHDIATIRGVNVDGVIRTLLQRGLITEAERKKGEGDLASKYLTTPLFLEKAGIKSLAELEPLAPFLPDDIAQIPEFDDIRKTARKAVNDDE